MDKKTTALIEALSEAKRRLCDDVRMCTALNEAMRIVEDYDDVLELAEKAVDTCNRLEVLCDSMMEDLERYERG